MGFMYGIASDVGIVWILFWGNWKLALALEGMEVLLLVEMYTLLSRQSLNIEV